MHSVPFRCFFRSDSLPRCPQRTGTHPRSESPWLAHAICQGGSIAWVEQIANRSITRLRYVTTFALHHRGFGNPSLTDLFLPVTPPAWSASFIALVGHLGKRVFGIGHLVRRGREETKAQESSR
jgi:hypothetical protein